jgi:hypothetical protein
MSEAVYTVRDRDGVTAPADFVQMVHESGLLEYFEFGQIMVPVLHFRDEFLHHIAEHGLTSLYSFSIVMEDITSPSLDINDIEKVVAQFVSQLDGAKRIMIVDPYLYAASGTIDVASLFKNLLGKAISALEEVIFVTNGQKLNTKTAIHAAVSALVPTCKIVDFTTDQFHDRFWVDPDAGRGLVMGTSLNGLGRKIALVDRLKTADVGEIVTLARAAGAPV